MADKTEIKLEGFKEAFASIQAATNAMINPESRAFDRSVLYMDTRTALTFNELAFGGSFRGVQWDYFAEASFGRKRPSGEIIQDGSKIMWDQGTLSKQAASVRSRSAGQVVMGPVGNSEAYADMMQEMREFLFFESGVDDEQIARIFAREYEVAWEDPALFAL